MTGYVRRAVRMLLWRRLECARPSHHVAKKVQEWEYAIEILRTNLRTRMENQPHTAFLNHQSFAEGAATQESGGPHAQKAWQALPEVGGTGHV